MMIRMKGVMQIARAGISASRVSIRLMRMASAVCAGLTVARSGSAAAA